MNAHITNGIVDFIMEADPKGIFGAPYCDEFIHCDDVNITNGWVYDGSNFTPPTPIYINPIPQSITKLQAMRAMKQTDVDTVANTSMWSNFQALLASNTDANDEWTLALDLQRNHPLVLALTPALGKTDAQIDELFILAGTL